MDKTVAQPVSISDLSKDLKQRFPGASDDDIAQAASAGLTIAQNHPTFGEAITSARGFDTSQLFPNYAACDSAAKTGRDAAITAAGAIPNILLKMAAIAAANAAYSYAQGVCHRMYPNG